MSRLLETLRFADGKCDDLAVHLKRMNHSRKCFWSKESPLTMSDILNTFAGLPISMPGIWKVRLLYGKQIYRLEAVQYSPVPIHSASLVDAGTLNYSHKWADRTALNVLNKKALEQGADAALLVKDGLITDFFHANAAFFDGERWWTPSLPLLPGTRRERLIGAGRLYEKDISPNDLSDYQMVCPVNAMLDLGELVVGTEKIMMTGFRLRTLF